jgi:hypothetical protein
VCNDILCIKIPYPDYLLTRRGIKPEASAAVELAYVACDDVAQDDDMSQPRDDSLSHQVGEHFYTVSNLFLNQNYTSGLKF